jgi:hypothetical protein
MSYMHANGYFPGMYIPEGDSLGTKVRVIPSMGVRAQSPAGTLSNVFNAAHHSSKAITYEFKINLQNEGFWQNTPFFKNTFLLGKDLDEKTNTKGWSFYSGDQGLNLSLLFQNGTDSIHVPFIQNNKSGWRHFAFTFKQLTTTTTNIEIFEDGELKESTIINMGVSEFENQDPFTVGFTPIVSLYSIPNFYVSGLRIWNKALSLNEVMGLSCINGIENSHPLYNNLLAYYRYFSEDKKWMNSIESTAPNFSLSGSATSRIAPYYSICNNSNNMYYPQVMDVLPQVFYWFDLDIPQDNKLADKEFLDTYLEEFWRD